MCIRTEDTKEFPLTHEVQIGSPCFLNFLLEKSLSADKSRLSLKSGQLYSSKELKSHLAAV